MRILVVDDDSFYRDRIAEYWAGLGHQVVAKAENGEEAVICYKQTRPDLVTMDGNMPVMDGLETLAAIRKFDPQAKVIICSADDELKHRAQQYGAIGFIPKPFTVDDFKVYG